MPLFRSTRAAPGDVSETARGLDGIMDVCQHPLMSVVARVNKCGAGAVVLVVLHLAGECIFYCVSSLIVYL